jgi:hypothetical protein
MKLCRDCTNPAVEVKLTIPRAEGAVNLTADKLSEVVGVMDQAEPESYARCAGCRSRIPAWNTE